MLGLGVGKEVSSSCHFPQPCVVENKPFPAVLPLLGPLKRGSGSGSTGKERKAKLPQDRTKTKTQAREIMVS